MRYQSPNNKSNSSSNVLSGGWNRKLASNLILVSVLVIDDDPLDNNISRSCSWTSAVEICASESGKHDVGQTNCTGSAGVDILLTNSAMWEGSEIDNRTTGIVDMQCWIALIFSGPKALGRSSFITKLFWLAKILKISWKKQHVSFFKNEYFHEKYQLY